MLKIRLWFLILFILSYLSIISPVSGETIFFEDGFELGYSSWSKTTNWWLDNCYIHSGNVIVRCGGVPCGWDYGPNWDATLTSPVIDLSTATNVYIHFWHLYDFYPFDGGALMAYDGSSFISEDSYTGSQMGSWTMETIDLSDYAGRADFQFRFHFFSDAALEGEGWYIDDIQVSDGSSWVPEFNPNHNVLIFTGMVGFVWLFFSGNKRRI